MRVTAAISKGFNVARSSLDLVMLLFVVGAVWSTLNALVAPQLTSEQPTPENLGIALGIAGIGLVFMLINIFLQGGSMGYVLAKIKSGGSALSEVTSSGKRFFGKLLLLGLFIALVVSCFLLVAALFVILLPEALRAVAIIAAVLIAAAAIVFSLLVFLAPYAIVNEGLGVMAAVKRSQTLVKKNLGGVLLLLLLVLGVGIAIGAVLGAVAGAAALAIPNEMVSNILFGVLGSLVNAFLGVLVTGAFTQFYLEASQS